MTYAPKRICILALGAAFAVAHEVPTHQNIGNAAVQYLQQSPQFMNRPALPNLQNLLLIGAQGEDNDPPHNPLSVIGRFYFHFDPSLSFSSVSGSVEGVASATCTSQQWGLEGASCTATCALSSPLTLGIPVCLTSLSAIDTNWAQDLAADNTGMPTDTSIERIGYVIHLLEDLGSPPHVRNDFHACPKKTVGGVTVGLNVYCDPFEFDNNNAIPNLATALALPTGSTAVISTAGYTMPEDFFNSLKSYVVNNYYSDNTVFAVPGPCSSPGPGCVEDPEYFYGPCITAASIARTCVTVGGQQVRRIAHKGLAYKASCIVGCIKVLAEIDPLIAQQQFMELGPVIAQHVAAFIQFYAPALTVQLQGDNGTGSVTSSPATGIDCGATCAALFVNGTMLTLTASDSPTETFSGWGQDCSGTDKTITITLTADTTCVANFSPPSMLTVQKSGNGTGTVTSAPTGLNCGTACLIQSAPFNGAVQLTAAPDTGSTFSSWGGACSGTIATTTVTVTTFPLTCIANFSGTGQLTITKTGTGGGTVTSVPPGINCGPTCMASLNGMVQLTANPDVGSTFTGWGDSCSGTAPTTMINVNGTIGCTATFNTPVAVVMNPFGAYSLSQQPGPYFVQAVNGALSAFPAPADISVVVHWEVDACGSVLFPQDVTVIIPMGQQTVGAPRFVAGRPPGCGSATTVWTILSASMGGTPLDLSRVPSGLLSLAITR